MRLTSKSIFVVSLALIVLYYTGTVIAASLVESEFSEQVPPSEGAHPSHSALYTVTTENVVMPILATGTVMAAKTSNIGPQIEGPIEEIYVRVGDRVNKGDALFRTRDVVLKLQLQELVASSALYAAESRNAQIEFNRVSDLRKKGVASGAQFDTSAVALETARARVDITASKLAQVEQSIDDAIVRAPYTGVITERFVDEGVFISSRASGMGNSAVVQVKKADPVVVVWSIAAKYLPEITLGAKVKIRINGIPDVIDSEINIIKDRIDIASRSIDARSVVNNDGYKIKPGLFARAEIFPKPHNVVLLPRSLLRGPPNDPYVLLYENGKERIRHLTIRDYNTDSVEVLSGLEAGMRVLPRSHLTDVSDDVVITRQKGLEN
ncbi:efflux RND transporter periplasmic adaptor subunit [Litorivivens sp.]|uniref:efflux RND transporter periplasmic adaptor subunit n=1 Tax=Litorivivens sp. TaxID=2020868 RepID=UPI003567E2F6